jgi:hypothetical protein
MRLIVDAVGCRLSAVGYRYRLPLSVLGSRFSVLGSRFSVAVVGSRLPVAGCRLPLSAAGCRLPVAAVMATWFAMQEIV